jgi:hypothetical protein
VTETIRIPLGPSGKPVAWSTIDLDMYEQIIAHRWYLAGRGYAFRTNNGRSIFLHREIVGFVESESIDHINGDQLDNRRANLRPCTQRENSLAGKSATVYPMVEQIRELRLDGWTNDAIAEHLGISTASVAKYAKDLPRAPHPSLVWTRDRIADFFRDFHAEHGRLPSQSELNGQDGRPWFPVIYRQFSSVMEARAYAGFGAVDFRKAAA